MKFNESIYNKERKENVTIELDSNTIVHEIKKLRDLGYTPGRIAYEMELPGDLVETYLNLIRNDELKEEAKRKADTDTSFVKLSLKEYEEMKNKINQQEVDISYLESEVKRLTDVLTKLGIPAAIIDKVGVDVPLSCFWADRLEDNTRNYRIEFEVAMKGMMGE